MKISGNLAKTSQGSLTKRLKVIEKKLSSLGDKIEEIGVSVKENVKSKKSSGTKHPGNMGHYEKTIPVDNRRRRKSGQRHKTI